MHGHSIQQWQHDHVFGQDQVQAGERRMRIVLGLTAVTMVAEIAAGIAFGSMALLADGLHMGSHAAAIGIAAFAYGFARRHARDQRFSFGTGKVNALAGFTGALMLAVFALLMAWESILRFFDPVPIAFGQAIPVAVLGLAVNIASVIILGGHHHHHHDDTGHDHDHGHDHHRHHDHHRGADQDHNLRSAYLHVLADALTSVLAIVALLAGLYAGLDWLDPAMGIAGAILVANWSWGLLRQSGWVLLDRSAPDPLQTEIRAAIEGHTDERVTELHVWSIGPNRYAAIVSLATHQPKSPEHYKALLPRDRGLVHVSVEVHHCA